MPNVSHQLRPDWAEIPQGEFRDQYSQLISVQDVAAFWKIPLSQLNYYAFHINKNRAYTTFTIPRRDANARKREIEVPPRTLKYIQRIIHESLVRIYGPHPAVHGFRTGRSIVTNANNHTGRRYVLNIDLADFFGTITRKRIYSRLVDNPYSLHPSVANLIAALSTNGQSSLPQGSPCSPVIANIVAAGMDTDLANLCGKLGCQYTRYADDITISARRGELPPQIARYPNARGTGQVVIGDALADIIEKHGFRLNDDKSRLQSYWTRQMCTGLVINGNCVSPPRKYIRHLRSLIDHWKKNGWRDAAEILHSKENRPLFESREQLMNHVIGKITYIKMVRGKNDPVSKKFMQAILSLPTDY